MIHILLPEDEAGKALAEFLRLKGYTVVTEGNDSLLLNAVDKRIKLAVDCLKQEGIIKHMYDYVWIMRYINERCKKKDDMFFTSVKSYRDYITITLHTEGVAQQSTLSLYYGYGEGRFPDWTFVDTNDYFECQRRVNVARRFAALFLKVA
ncbi:MAG: hypothetical protein IJ618_01515 [Prevotella sp.]|nr:hypothetical protein [Prevotella sp.]